MSQLSASQRERIMQRDGWQCRQCGSGDSLEVDHIVPTYAGGTDEPGNLQTLCRSCHQRKTSADAANPAYNEILRNRIGAGRAKAGGTRWGWGRRAAAVVAVATAVVIALAL